MNIKQDGPPSTNMDHLRQTLINTKCFHSDEGLLFVKSWNCTGNPMQRVMKVDGLKYILQDKKSNDLIGHTDESVVMSFL